MPSSKGGECLDGQISGVLGVWCEHDEKLDVWVFLVSALCLNKEQQTSAHIVRPSVKSRCFYAVVLLRCWNTCWSLKYTGFRPIALASTRC